MRRSLIDQLSSRQAARPGPGRSERRRRVAMMRAAWGACLLVIAGRATRAATGPIGRGVIVVLALRHIIQSAVDLVRPNGLIARRGATIDLVHAVATFVLAAVSRRWRVPALTDCGLATAWSVCDRPPEVSETAVVGHLQRPADHDDLVGRRRRHRPLDANHRLTRVNSCGAPRPRKTRSRGATSSR
jgi:hypothetical protein